MEKHNIRVGITMGDINGIGPEIIIKALADTRYFSDFTPIIYGSAKVMSFHKKAIDDQYFNFQSVKNADEAKPKKVSVINCWNEEVQITLGESNTIGGEYAFKSLEAATKDLAANKIDVLVTAPINKKSIQDAGFKFPGHTEYLADLANVKEALMLMVYDNLRVALVTAHEPLKDVAAKISKESVTHKINQLHQSLTKDFGIRRPKIAVLGLNPHAGERGNMGDEEINHIIPAIGECKSKEMLVYGPYAADSFFGSENLKNFDGIVAMYHDQGLTGFKSIAFGNGVNYTAGLPIVRTSPDHGTAMDIAGKNIAKENSFRNAIFLALDVYKNRMLEKEITANPLKVQKSELKND
ncbi:MAG: 4-hydroxythreonine-4-phosphate dehydrogenase PdxA [Crocinitomicaceae bacterium]|nr:4-hydroxythreonine-4-phosphate dehydrogenase PdxA [Crocinitomicaceae bacterium]